MISEGRGRQLFPGYPGCVSVCKVKTPYAALDSSRLCSRKESFERHCPVSNGPMHEANFHLVQHRALQKATVQ